MSARTYSPWGAALAAVCAAERAGAPLSTRQSHGAHDAALAALHAIGFVVVAVRDGAPVWVRGVVTSPFGDQEAAA